MSFVMLVDDHPECRSCRYWLDGGIKAVGLKLNRFAVDLNRPADSETASQIVPPLQLSAVSPYAALRAPGIPQARRRGASHDISSSAHARRHAGAAAVAVHPTDVRRDRRAVRSSLRPFPGSSRSGGDPRLPALPDQRTPSCAELAGRRRVGAPLPLSGHAPEAVGLRRRDPRAEEAPGLAGRSQPRGGDAVSRRGQGRQTSRHPDHVLRRRPAHLRGCPPHGVRHRQRTDGAAHREG